MIENNVLQTSTTESNHAFGSVLSPFEAEISNTLLKYVFLDTTPSYPSGKEPISDEEYRKLQDAFAEIDDPKKQFTPPILPQEDIDALKEFYKKKYPQPE
jgi:hypothetical protein